MGREMASAGRAMRRVEIVDAGLGNPASVANMFSSFTSDVAILDSPSMQTRSSIVVLPGVGAFDYGVRRLATTGWFATLQERASEGGHILGICLGMELLTEGSDEGIERGLGIVPGRFRSLSSLPDLRGLKIPHMGWNHVSFDAERASWTERLGRDLKYYFAHSFTYVAGHDDAAVAHCDYGKPLAAALAHGWAFGVQFHPEKSHRYGAALLKEYTEWTSA